MKKITLILICLTFLVACSSDDSTSPNEKFSLINVSGGFAGVNENFDLGEITWTFNSQNESLTIEKNIQKIFSGMSEGTYSYSFQTINDEKYIFINTIESGSVTNQENGMIINENESSVGSGADRFVYQLEK